jgi:hypothetical protein
MERPWSTFKGKNCDQKCILESPFLSLLAKDVQGVSEKPLWGIPGAR